LEIFIIAVELLWPFEVMEITQFFLEQIFKNNVELFWPILADSLLEKSVFILILINTLDVDR